MAALSGDQRPESPVFFVVVALKRLQPLAKKEQSRAHTEASEPSEPAPSQEEVSRVLRVRLVNSRGPGIYMVRGC